LLLHLFSFHTLMAVCLYASARPIDGVRGIMSDCSSLCMLVCMLGQRHSLADLPLTSSVAFVWIFF